MQESSKIEKSFGQSDPYLALVRIDIHYEISGNRYQNLSPFGCLYAKKNVRRCVVNRRNLAYQLISVVGVKHAEAAKLVIRQFVFAAVCRRFDRKNRTSITA